MLKRKLVVFLLFITPLISIFILSPSISANHNDNTPHSNSSITGISIDLHATMHNIGIQINYTGDENNNATATLEANIDNQGFKAVHRLSRVANNRFVGTVFSVVPDTDVSVRVTLSDADGVSNGVLSAETTTRSEVVPPSIGETVHVSVNNGNDQTGNGSAQQPYASIQQAVERIKTGTTILVHEGVYHEQIDVPFGYGGQDDNPATIRSAGDGEVILEGFSDPLKEPNAWSSEGNNIYSATVEQSYFVGVDGKRLWRYETLADLTTLRFKTSGGFYIDKNAKKVYVKLPNNEAPTEHQMQVSTLKYAFMLNNINNLVIDGLTFRGYGVDRFSRAISISEESARIWIVNSRFENMGTAIWLEGYSEDVIVMNNDFSDYGVTDFHWELVKEHQWWLERGAVFCSNDGYSGRGLIFYKNKVHNIFDGIKLTGLEKDQQYPTNSDVENNVFTHLADDGVETDGWSSNVRIINNRFEDLLAGVSVAPALGGPTYIIGNIMDNLNNVAQTEYETTAVKFNVSDEPPSGEIFIYHNTATTFEAKQAAFSVTNHTASSGVFMKNNIWAGTQYSFYYWLDTVLNFNEDYDLHFSTGDNTFLYQGKEYKTLSAYNSQANLCQHCKIADPLFKDHDNGDYNLTATSPAIDQGILIPGVNETYLGSAPDMGAIEYAE